LLYSIPSRRMFNGALFPPQKQMRFQSVRQQLALQIPKELPCRENEISRIYNRLSSSIREGTSLTMYIAGQPGTGKTACVLKALNMITDEWQRNSCPPFHLCYVNAMALTSPKEIYHQVWKIIAPTKQSAKKVLKQDIPKKVANFFCQRSKNKMNSTERNMYTVIIIDELDFLLTRDQKNYIRVYGLATEREFKTSCHWYF